MLEHRRNLGYVPEPLPDVEDLAYFIRLAASRDPVAAIWKWLNPWNDFGMADLFMNRDRYRRLLDELREKRSALESRVAARIARYAPEGVEFEDTVTFAVNFGIRSWATRYSLGTNVIQFKDRTAELVRTITHESFHRLQLELCPVDTPSVGRRSPRFEDLVRRRFPVAADRKLYEALSYVMLEGTATLVGGAPPGWDARAQAEAGRDLLAKIVEALYAKQDTTRFDELVDEGLRSNGPFYALGYWMGKRIEEERGSEEIGRLLRAGAPAFFLAYVESVPEKEESLELPPDVVEKAKRLIAPPGMP
jgi:hypothetical protein